LSEKLSDIEVRERLLAAMQTLGDEEAETEHGNAALKAARKALWLCSCGLVRVFSRRAT